MFGKNEKKEPKTQKNWNSAEIKSILAKELKISGNINAEGKVRIDGQIEGDITGDYVILGNSASVKGNVKASVLILQGNVEGNIYADKLEVKSTATIEGEIFTKSLTVESGASVSGKMSSGKFHKSSGNPDISIKGSSK